MSVSSIGGMSPQVAPYNSQPAANGAKKPEDGSDKELTTITTHCNKDHEHNQNRPTKIKKSSLWRQSFYAPQKYRKPNGGFEITIKAAVLSFSYAIFGSYAKVTLFIPVISVKSFPNIL